MRRGWNRRDVIVGVSAVAAAGVASAPQARAALQRVALPPPRTDGGLPVMQALMRRRSTRSFATRPLDPQTMSDLLWAAFGINRPETADRTAPSWRHSIETDVYACTAEGVFVYEPKAHALAPVLDTDIRARTSSMTFAATAPVVLVYAADLARMAKAPREDQVLNAHVDAAIIGENVYLFCASAGLATVILGSIDRAGLPQRMGLRVDQIVTFAQPVGHPA
ncbi:MAG: nitroreductase [Bradyrhizobiaceae bacterium]|nr:MAG: nitroreductase [Bradyrhizobiaceae bacterium]